MINFLDLNLNINNNVNIIKFGEHQIEVLQYLPIEDKNSIIKLALQNSEENGVYNPVKLEMYSKLYIIYMYTNLEFTEEEQQDEPKLYDILYSNGIIEEVLGAMDEDELRYYDDMLDAYVSIKTSYRHTLASVVNSFIEELPKNATAAKDIIEKFNPEDFKEVLNFAFAANGNRPI